MKRLIALIISLALTITTISSCTNNKGNKEKTITTEILNGGFETGNLSGWTIQGNAFTDDCVSSHTTFSFPSDLNHNEISVNKTGNWFLYGRAFDNSYSFARTGSLRSSSFVLSGDGTISMKLAGGALTVGRGSSIMKDIAKICYVGIYRSTDDRMIARQTNEYFLEHTEEYVNPSKYASGTYNTDNFYEYTLDLSEYIGQELYLMIVDNDMSNYYGYISVDDIRVNSEKPSQKEGVKFTKNREYVENVLSESIYQIANGDFEVGSLAGWDIIEGDAFSNAGVNSEEYWWNENISYNREGNYHYGFYRPSAVGVMRSSEFVLGGSGFVSFKLGGCADKNKCYLRFILKNAENDIEIARFSNERYLNFQFPYIANGMKLLNLVQYYADLSRYIGETMYIEVVDNDSSFDDLHAMTLDSIITYWEEKPVWYDSESFLLHPNDEDIEVESIYQVKNGTFETGDLSGWEMSDSSESGRIGYVTDESVWWSEGLPYNGKGRYLFTGLFDEGKTGTLTSSEFTVGGCGMITYLLGGCGNPKLCYLSILDAETNEELYRFSNTWFNDLGINLINKGSNLANMVLYKADLKAIIGRKVKLQLVDNAINNWGLIVADSFITYYADSSSLPKDAKVAENLLNDTILGEDNEYQVLNGDFETGDLTGWKMSGNIGKVGTEETYWNECYPFKKTGTYFFTAYNPDVEGETGVLESSSFIIGGSGFITFSLGGMGNVDTYLEIIDEENGNTLFKCSNTNIDKCTLIRYKADLSEFLGKKVYIKITDNAVNNYGLIFCDEFITYYKEEPVGQYNIAVNILNNN